MKHTSRLSWLLLRNRLRIINLYRLVNECLSIRRLNQLRLRLLLDVQKVIVNIIREYGESVKCILELVTGAAATVDCPENLSVRFDLRFGGRYVQRFVDHWRSVALDRFEPSELGCW